MNMYDTAFEMTIANIRFGEGITHEVGMDLAEMGAKKVLVITDPVLATLPPVQKVCESLSRQMINFDLFIRVRIEPSDKSFLEAIAFAKEGQYDSFVAVGGGSTIDTAKVANLYSTFPDELLAYVNSPIGQGKPIPGPLKPLIAIPTTAGTGSETTGVAIFDLLERKIKTGISHKRLKPILGIVDPENTRTMPPMVTASTGMDVLCHAIESYTAIPYNSRPRPESPALRPTYQGSNPISDIWAEHSLRIAGKYLKRAFEDPFDDEARRNMLLASLFAGMGFSNAGVHLCHAMSYPICSMVRNYSPPDYPADHSLVPHGMSVTLAAPAVFRFIASSCPERHLKAAEILGANISGVKLDDAGKIFADLLIRFMQRLGFPNGLSAIGFTEEDLPRLAEGTLPQQRLTKLSPRQADREDLIMLFHQSLRIW